MRFILAEKVFEILPMGAHDPDAANEYRIILTSGTAGLKNKYPEKESN